MSETFNFPLVVENDDGIRPAGQPNQCFYCNSLIGESHKHYCVAVTKKVKLKYEFEIEVDVPHSWSEDDILLHRNEGSWCADNSIQELQKYSENNGCLCGVFLCTFIKVVDETPRTELREMQNESL